MDGVCIAKQVVQVSQDLLIGADEKHAETIGRAVQGMERQRVLDVAPVDELIDLAIRVARDVAEDGPSRRPLGETVDRHDRKEVL
ncbi:MAG TPA: hypothetical protein VLV86_25560, partial [Vicinamibacterales bacterium]|nr:hypothetical protein [Vicinamibacterales bacterium]